LPGYRRVIRIEPERGLVTAMLEDDIHCMAVRLSHADGLVTGVEPVMERVPWTTCPGAAAVLSKTFAGLPLAEVTSRREKKRNCTHLHDLAVFAAAHAGDCSVTELRCFASDPQDGVRILEIWRGEVREHRWIERDGLLTEPEGAAGTSLLTMRDWIASLSGSAQESARMLQWAAIVAHGRTLPEERQNVATDIPPNCYTFQPERAVHAHRTGARFDFSQGSRVPLAVIRDRLAAT
jgi:hypothetical protein